MVSRRQEKMIGLAWEAMGRGATPRQVWRWISSNYKAHGFKSQMSVAHAIKALKNRKIFGD